MRYQFSWDEIKKWLTPEPTTTKPGICCASLYPEGLALAYIIRVQDKPPILQYCQFIPCAAADLVMTLTDWVNEHQLNGAACVWLLQTVDYKLLNIPALPVETNEMAAALRWHIKDLIDFPIADAAIDYFPAPATVAMGKKSNNINVVVSRVGQLQSIANSIQNSGLILTTIDIPELALRNCAALFDKTEQGVALIWTNYAINQLIIVAKQYLYHSRVIDEPNLVKIAEQKIETVDNALGKQLEKFILGLQRSLDYYQSQLRQLVPATMLITLNQPVLLDYLSSHLINKLIPLEMNTVLDCQTALTEELQWRCLGVIGGALRET